MKKLIEVRSGDTIPDGAVFISKKVIQRHDRAREEWRQTPGFWGSIPIFGTETLYRITPQEEVYVYEVEVKP